MTSFLRKFDLKSGKSGLRLQKPRYNVLQTTFESITSGVVNGHLTNLFFFFHHVGRWRQTDWAWITSKSLRRRNRFVFCLYGLNYCIILRVLIISLDSLVCWYAEAYDKMQKELMTATNSLTKILTSTDIKATVCVTLKHYADVSWYHFEPLFLILITVVGYGGEKRDQQVFVDTSWWKHSKCIQRKPG